jgi:hypothetical protein
MIGAVAFSVVVAQSGASMIGSRGQNIITGLHLQPKGALNFDRAKAIVDPQSASEIHGCR